METDPTSALRKAPLFADLDKAALAERSGRRRFPAGKTLFHEGDPRLHALCDHLEITQQ